VQRLAVGQLSLRLPKGKLPALKQPSEAQIEMSICHYLQVRGFFFWKAPNGGFFDTKTKRFRKHVNPYVRNGIPDIILVHKGQFIGLEVKSEKGRLSDDQKYFHQEAEKNGAKLFVVRSIDDVEAVLRGVLNGN